MRMSSHFLRLRKKKISDALMAFCFHRCVETRFHDSRFYEFPSYPFFFSFFLVGWRVWGYFYVFEGSPRYWRQTMANGILRADMKSEHMSTQREKENVNKDSKSGTQSGRFLCFRRYCGTCDPWFSVGSISWYASLDIILLFIFNVY